MPRITKPLSSTEVKNAKPKEKEYTLRDGGGLYLRITPTGSRIWLFDYYRPITKKRTNMAFGPYPEVSLAQARQKRDEARALLAQGTDPREWEQQQAEQARAVTEHTFRAVAERWFELKKPSVTANYADDLIRSLELFLFPVIGDLPIAEVKAQTAIRAIEPIAASGKLETVRRLTQRVNEIMTYAVNSGLIDANPCSGISKVFQKPEKNHMPTLTPNQCNGSPRPVDR
ncbi:MULTISPECIES: integrase arm-type DNA-binding domain-containing protein [unclassified Aeromonas]|uniref:integrase arm-type DNA-binding domain-containing protein n=1 Tax=unclassified Aeromonas TaxID=257493 RepID=UPI0022E332CC|nr:MULTISPECIES: integrase arm-type DNA-binding domain-containing protein [unclassified Aeromonas]